jgi:hypothetical protein
MIRERQEQQTRLSASYDRSEAPIHLIASPVGAPLVQLYHGKARRESNWLWQWLYIDMVGLRFTVMNEIPVKEERELTAFQIGSLFSLGISLPFRPVRKGETAARDRYFEWLNTKLLTPLERANPGFIESVAHVVARDIERTCRH